MVVATPVAGSDQTSVTEEKLKQDRRVALQKADDYGRFAEQARRENSLIGNVLIVLQHKWSSAAASRSTVRVIEYCFVLSRTRPCIN